jgi:hypothetical protein
VPENLLNIFNATRSPTPRIKNMAKIKRIHMSIIDDLFNMNDGYVLHFSNRTFADFFQDELSIDIDDDEYFAEGGSKAKRLRYFLKNSSPEVAANTLRSLWDYRQHHYEKVGIEDPIPNSQQKLQTVISNILGKEPIQADTLKPATPNYYDLSTQLVSLTNMSPHRRGYEFERLLKRLFQINNLDPMDAFRIKGEQIDGSFNFNNDIYLLEAKWQNNPSPASELHVFHGKIEQKASWTRGLFVSYSGFSQDATAAFGRGKSIICMDGLDLHDLLKKNLPLSEVLSMKIRKAAETGEIMARVRDYL